MITEEERKQILKNEERLWDMAAITAAPTIYQLMEDSLVALPILAEISYDIADALILERRRRLKEGKPVEPASPESSS